jgi:hypothetical protein
MEIGRFFELLKRAMDKLCEGYSDAELKVLLRYAAESYQSILGATNQLKTMMEATPKAKSRAIRKPARAP